MGLKAASSATGSLELTASKLASKDVIEAVYFDCFAFQIDHFMYHDVTELESGESLCTAGLNLHSDTQHGMNTGLQRVLLANEGYQALKNV